MRFKNQVVARIVLSLALLAFAAPAWAQSPAQPRTQTAVLAGGCFWGMEAVFESLRGVTNVVSGFSGGAAATAHYDMVSEGNTGHAESVQITYDPAQISYAQLLRVYFLVAHDPTQVNRQGPDEGTQYRSSIFYIGDDQRRTAETTIAQLTKAHTFSAPIATKVVAFQAFYPAEAYHQHFVQRNPTYPYVVVEDLPKLQQLKQTFPTLVKPGSPT